MKKASGFTLIEVLVALAIIAIALLAVIKVTAQSVRETAQLKDKMSAHWVAMNVLAKVQVGLIKMDRIDNLEGYDNLLGSQWHWRMEMKRKTDPRLDEIRVTVSAINSHRVVDELWGAR